MSHLRDAAPEENARPIGRGTTFGWSFLLVFSATMVTGLRYANSIDQSLLAIRRDLAGKLSRLEFARWTSQLAAENKGEMHVQPYLPPEDDR